jgi:hypothetical protein
MESRSDDPGPQDLTSAMLCSDHLHAWCMCVDGYPGSLLCTPWKSLPELPERSSSLESPWSSHLAEPRLRLPQLAPFPGSSRFQRMWLLYQAFRIAHVALTAADGLWP